jgi:hypothetical protein
LVYDLCRKGKYRQIFKIIYNKIMDQRPWSIFYAMIPDFDTPLENIGGVGNIQKSVVLKLTKVLVLGGSQIDCNCLPIFENTDDGAYIPIRDEWFVNPLFMSRVAYKDFYSFPFPSLSHTEYGEISKHIEALYRLGIEQSCQKFYWVDTPNVGTSDANQCGLKRRPVISMRDWLHFPTSTNNGRYSAPWPAIRIGNKPSKVSFVPIFLPQHFFSKSSWSPLPLEDKKSVQEHLLYHLPKVFTNPY